MFVRKPSQDIIIRIDETKSTITLNKNTIIPKTRQESAKKQSG